MDIFDNLVETIMDFLKIPSVQTEAKDGMPFGEANFQALEKMLDLCRSFGFYTKNVDGYVGWAEIGGACNENSSNDIDCATLNAADPCPAKHDMFGVLAHLDVVPFGENWTKNPLGEIEDGIIYGRGVVDDKGPALAALFAAKKLLDDGYRTKRRLRFIFGCNEESGWECMKRYVKTEEMPTLAFSPDADFPVINAEKGTVVFELTLPLDADIEMTAGERPNVVPDKCRAVWGGATHLTEGKSAHGSTPEEGDNAIVKMLEKFQNEDESLKLLYNALKNTDGSGLGLKISDSQSGSLTVNLGIIKTDASAKTITAVLDIRYPVSFLENSVLRQLEQTFKSAKITKTGGHAPLYIDKDHFLIKTLLGAYEKVTGKKGEAIAIGGGTYARAVPVGVAFGPMLPGCKSTVHSPDECMSLADLKIAFDIYYEALKALCFEK